MEDEAYAMQRAYRETPSYAHAVETVKRAYPDISEEVLGAMWRAIDAYIDMEPANE